MVLTAPPYRPLFDSNTAARSLLIGLVAYWPLDEASGTRADKVGVSALTDNNTVTGAAGPSGKLPLASQFTAANSEFLSVADNAALSMGAGARFTIGGHLYPDAIPATVFDILGKNNAGTAREYRVNKGTNNRLNLEISPDGATPVATAQSGLTLAAATWYTWMAGYDGAHIWIRTNNGPVVRTAHSTDVFDGAVAFQIGKVAAGTNYVDGRMCGIAIWKRDLTAAEQTYWHNDGNGRTFVPGLGFF